MTLLTALKNWRNFPYFNAYGSHSPYPYTIRGSSLTSWRKIRFPSRNVQFARKT